MQYWIVVVSKDHIERGVKGGFIQANHGKAGPLKRLNNNDWVICYSPKLNYGQNELCQCFTAIGQVADGSIYKCKISDNFIPYRRNICYYKAVETAIGPLIEKLDFIKNKKSWGYPFRFGFFEISENDFEIIRTQMLNN